MKHTTGSEDNVASICINFGGIAAEMAGISRLHIQPMLCCGWLSPVDYDKL